MTKQALCWLFFIRLGFPVHTVHFLNLLLRFLFPAAFSLSNLTIQPVTVSPEKPVTITVSVANRGGIQGSCTVVLELNGVMEKSQSISIAAGSTKKVEFTVSRQELGVCAVRIGDLEGSFTVSLPPVPTETTAPKPESPQPEVPTEPQVPIEKSEINRYWYIGGTILGIVVLLAIFLPIWVRRKNQAKYPDRLGLPYKSLKCRLSGNLRSTITHLVTGY